MLYPPTSVTFAVALILLPLFGMVSFFILRKKDPHLERLYKMVYPVPLSKGHREPTSMQRWP